MRQISETAIAVHGLALPQIPVADIALAAVQPHGDGRAVRLETDGVMISYGDSDNVRPAGDVALPLLGVTGGNDRAARLESNGIAISCGDRNDVRPAGDVALAIIMIPHSDDRPIRLQSDGVIRPCGNSPGKLAIQVRRFLCFTALAI